MEYCYSTLSTVLSSITKPLYESQVRKIFYSIVSGLKFLHNHDIIHRANLFHYKLTLIIIYYDLL